MTKPESVDHGASFDLSAIERELRDEAAYERNGYAARTLVRTDDLRLVFIAMRENSHIAEHEASDTVAIHVVRGQVHISLADRAFELQKGQLLTLRSGLRHDVTASVDSAFLLTLGWSK